MTPDGLISIYEKVLDSTVSTVGSEFPAAPGEHLAPGDFVALLIRRAAEHDGRAAHSFLKNVAGGRYAVPRLREWVRQDYQTVISSIRRHALAAASASDCETLRALLAYVGIEADADPVGGNYFSLPQLWVKFGVALGLNREEIQRAEQARELRAWNDQAMEAARSAMGVPIAVVINAIISPALAKMIGMRLLAQLAVARDSLDYFWAIAGNGWGADVGRPLLASWCHSPAQQRAVWEQYAAERKSALDVERLSILQRAVETAPLL